MKLIFTLALLLLSFTSFSQTWEITPNYIKIPSVSTLPDCIAGRIVFKTPENKLYSCDGSSWKPLSFFQQEGFSAPIKCCSTSYPNYPSVVDLDNAEFSYGTGGFSATNNSYTVPADGAYSISASFTTSTFDSTPVNFFLTIYIYKNGNVVRMHVQSNLSSGTNATARLNETLQLNAGDILQMKIAHNYTKSLSPPNPAGSYLSILRLYWIWEIIQIYISIAVRRQVTRPAGGWPAQQAKGVKVGTTSVQGHKATPKMHDQPLTPILRTGWV